MINEFCTICCASLHLTPLFYAFLLCLMFDLSPVYPVRGRRYYGLVGIYEFLLRWRPVFVCYIFCLSVPLPVDVRS